MMLVVVALGVLGLCCMILPPIRYYRLWGVVVATYAFCPSVETLDARVGPGSGIPLDYVPLLAIMGFAAASAIFRGMVSYSTLPRPYMFFSLCLLTYAILSLFWITDRAGWVREFCMFGFYICTFSIMTSSLSLVPVPLVTSLIRFIALMSTVFAFAGIVRILSGPGRYFGDISPLIYYRSSEVLVLCFAFPIALSLYFHTGRRSHLVSAILLGCAMLLSCSRTGYIGIGGSLAVLFLLARKRFQTRQRLVRVFASSLVALLLVVVLSEFLPSDSIVGLVTSRFKSFAVVNDGVRGNLLVEELGGRRMGMLEVSKSIFYSRPLRGAGFGNYLSVADTMESNPYLLARSHNFYASYLAELGILGFLPLLALVLYPLVLASGTRIAHEQPVQMAVQEGLIAVEFSVLLMLCFQEFVSGPYFWFYWGLAASFHLSARRPQRVEQSVTRRCDGLVPCAETQRRKDARVGE